MILGERIKKAIEAKGLSPDEVAVHAGMAVSNIYKIFKRESVESKYLEKIAEMLEIPVGALFDDQFIGAITQSGIGNAGGNINKQKIMAGKDQSADTAPNHKIVKLQHDLALCETEKASMEEKLMLKDEIIELLRGRK